MNDPVRMQGLLLFLRIFLVLISVVVRAQTGIIITDSTSTIRLAGDKVTYLIDSSSRLTVDSLLHNSSLKFQNGQEDFNNGKFGETNCWIRFRIHNKSAKKTWLIEIPDLHVSHVELYQNDSLMGKGGYLENFNIRPVHHKNPSYFIQPNDSTWYHLKLSSQVGANYTVLLRSIDFFSFYAHREYYFLGMYYGILFIMCVYHFLLFLKLRESVYLLYSLYVITCGLHTFREDGIAFQYFWPDFPVLNYYLKDIGILLLMGSFAAYSICFLDLKKKHILYYYGAIGSCLLYLLLFVYKSLTSSIHNAHSFLYLLPYIIIYIASVDLYLKGNLYNRYFIAACSVLLISVTVYLLRIFSLLDHTTVVVYNFNFGFVVEVLIMSLALADKFRIERRDKERAHDDAILALSEKDKMKDKWLAELRENEKLKEMVNKELEEKIQQRTSELENKNKELLAANEKLDALYTHLEQMNVSLDKTNWELNKEIKARTFLLIIGENIGYSEFLKVFPNEHFCVKYLSELKWKDGYICRKCGNDKFNEADKAFTCKCTRCNFKESATANTLFHGVRFELTKAFYLTYLFSRNKKVFTLEQLSEMLEVNILTCRKFKAKIEEKQKALGTKGRRDIKWEDLVL